MHTFIVRDMRLAGWKPQGDVLEVDANTPLQWVIDNIKKRGAEKSGDVKVIFMAHGLPGYVQCANGIPGHREAGNGITINDVPTFAAIAGSVKRIEFYSCLTARIGAAPEAPGMSGADGNAFCFTMAQATKAEVKASIHLQYYNKGTVGQWIFKRPSGKGINFGEWNGKVFTWGAAGNIINTEQFPYDEG
jgi:hypothetical protein